MLAKRSLQSRVSAVPGIIDAIIEDEKVRAVTREAEAPDIAGRLADIADIQVEAAEPVFEDAFVALLKSEHAVAGPGFAAKVGAGPGTGTVIEVSHVHKRFGEFHAVRDVSFSVKRGEVFGLLGANGAGKSTTFRMLCGLLPATSGDLTVAGHDLRRAAADARSRLGYMAQRFSLYVDLTVTENLQLLCQRLRS